MTVSNFITEARTRLNDADGLVFTNAEIMSALNDAITQLSLERIGNNDVNMVSEISITPNTTTKPEGFVKFVGQEPFYIDGNNKFQSLTGATAAATARCYVAKSHVSQQTDTLPFDDKTSLGILIDYAVVLAGARIGYSSQTESALADRMNAAYLNKQAVSANA